MTVRLSCRSCWFSGMEPATVEAAYQVGGPMRWTCMLGRRPPRAPDSCPAHAPDQGRAPTAAEIKVARVSVP